MLKRVYRLPSFVRLPQSHSNRSPYFIVKYLPNTLDHSRASVVISKKVSPNATERNRLKRLVHTYLEKHIDSWTPPLDVLIILSPAVTKISEETFTTILKQNLDKLS